MIEAGRRRRNQPAPPPVVYEALTQPARDPARPWLRLLADEVRPDAVEAVAPDLVVRSSLWVRRPDARIRFQLATDRAGHGTELHWTLWVEEPPPDASLLGHMRRRLNELINADLRYSFGQ